MSIFVAPFKVSQVYIPSAVPQACSCQTADVLQAQPMLSFHMFEATLILRPPSVEILRPVTSSLKHSPPPSIVHVAPDREGLPTPSVYGVHSQPSAAQDIGLLAIKGEGVQAADCRGDTIHR